MEETDGTEASRTFGGSESFLYWGREVRAEERKCVSNTGIDLNYGSGTKELSNPYPWQSQSLGEWDLQPPDDANSFHLPQNCGLFTLLPRECLWTDRA